MVPGDRLPPERELAAKLGVSRASLSQALVALEVQGPDGMLAGGIYEADYRDFNRETYARGRATFDATYAAFKRLLLAAWRRDELAQAALRKEPA